MIDNFEDDERFIEHEGNQFQYAFLGFLIKLVDYLIDKYNYVYNSYVLDGGLNGQNLIEIRNSLDK